MSETPDTDPAGFSNNPEDRGDAAYQPGWDTVELYTDDADEWRWRYKSANGVDVLADSAEGYTNEADARSAAGRVTGYAAEVKTARRGLRFERVES